MTDVSARTSASQQEFGSNLSKLRLPSAHGTICSRSGAYKGEDGSLVRDGMEWST